MKSINLYALTRHIHEDNITEYLSALFRNESLSHVRNEEITQIGVLVDLFLKYKVQIEAFDDWFYSFTIPQIGKEFDLLKIGTNSVAVNIELKSQEIEPERIKRQLEQNRYYLSVAANCIYSFTLVQKPNGENAIYQLTDDLREVSFWALVEAIYRIDSPICDRVEDYFKVNNYLISPINTPDKFLNQQYFLTEQQEEFKKKILNGINAGKSIWGITGGAGTGKTLLLYDIAYQLSKQYKVCVIHSGILAAGHNVLNEKYPNMPIFSAKAINFFKEKLVEYDIICVDEAQRLYESSIDYLLSLVNEKNTSAIVFSYDYYQVLSKKELEMNNPQRFKKQDGFTEYTLSNRIRTNQNINSFVQNILRLKNKPSIKMDYSGIDIFYANGFQEADKLIEIYAKKGYQFITFTPSAYVEASIDHFSKNLNSHEVIGQEFDKVLIVMDENFRYNLKGDLEGKPHPNPQYLFPKLFYQNITRAREALGIIVLNNPVLFEKILMVRNQKL